MCFRIGIFWFVFNVLASFLAYRIYSFNCGARALIRGVHYVIIPKKISHFLLEILLVEFGILDFGIQNSLRNPE